MLNYFLHFSAGIRVVVFLFFSDVAHKCYEGGCASALVLKKQHIFHSSGTTTKQTTIIAPTVTVENLSSRRQAITILTGSGGILTSNLNICGAQADTPEIPRECLNGALVPGETYLFYKHEL